MTSASIFLSELQNAAPILKRFANSLSCDFLQPDDLVQETMLRAWQARDCFDLRCGIKVTAWLCTIMRNYYFSELRHRRYEVEDPDDKFASQLGTVAKYEVEIEFDEVRRALCKLPGHQREALLMVCANGLSYEEAAQRCVCSVGTIKSRIGRGRQQLFKTLARC